MSTDATTIHAPRGQASIVSIPDVREVPTADYVNLTVQQIVQSAADLQHLTEAMAAGKSQGQVCHLFKCNRTASLIEAIEETVQVLEKTRNAFKSKTLGKLRSKLEDVLASASGNSA